MFLMCSHGQDSVPACPMNSNSAPATPEDLVDALAFALRFEGRRRVYHADDSMARITADRLVRYLEKSGFVVMKRPPGALPRA
jgi:hypothetical protein